MIGHPLSTGADRIGEYSDAVQERSGAIPTALEANKEVSVESGGRKSASSS